MTDTSKSTSPLAQLRDNRLDLDAAIADAVGRFDPLDPRQVEHLAALSLDYRLTIAALAFHELVEAPRG